MRLASSRLFSTRLFSTRLFSARQLWRRKARCRHHRSRLLFEPLEARRLLAANLQVVLSSATVSEGAGASAVTLTIQRLEPLDLTTALTVNLSADDNDELRLPATAVIQANQSTTVIRLDTINDGVVDGTSTVKVTASSPGYVSGEASVQVLDDDSVSSKTIGGVISGVLPRDRYRVSHSLAVLLDQSLNLAAGTVIEFRAGQWFDVYGSLQARALGNDAIRLVSASVTPKPGDWNGLQFAAWGNQPRSYLENVVISHAVTGLNVEGVHRALTLDTVDVSYSSGNGVEIREDINEADVIVQNSRVRNNGGDGIVLIANAGPFCGSGSTGATITRSEIVDNSRHGIAMHANASSGCLIGNASAYLSSPIVANRIHGNQVGIFAQVNNSTSRTAFYSPTIVNNLIYDNSSDAIQLQVGLNGGYLEPKIINNTIVRNGGAGLRHAVSLSIAARVVNNLISSNGRGIESSVAFVPQANTVAYNNLFGNSGANWTNYPASFGTVSTANSNGVPADVYQNTAVDPVWRPISCI